MTIGLIAANAVIVAPGAERDWARLAITATTFAIASVTRLPPLVVFVCAALMGLFGLV